MMEGKSPAVVPPEARIDISFHHKPQPSEIRIEQFTDDGAAAIPFTEGSITAPGAKGVYYYGISAYWRSSDGKYSNGDASSVFAIEVR